METPPVGEALLQKRILGNNDEEDHEEGEIVDDDYELITSDEEIQIRSRLEELESLNKMAQLGNDYCLEQGKENHHYRESRRNKRKSYLVFEKNSQVYERVLYERPVKRRRPTSRTEEKPKPKSLNRKRKRLKRDPKEQNKKHLRHFDIDSDDEQQKFYNQHRDSLRAAVEMPRNWNVNNSIAQNNNTQKEVEMEVLSISDDDSNSSEMHQLRLIALKSVIDSGRNGERPYSPTDGIIFDLDPEPKLCEAPDQNSDVIIVDDNMEISPIPSPICINENSEQVDMELALSDDSSTVYTFNEGSVTITPPKNAETAGSWIAFNNISTPNTINMRDVNNYYCDQSNVSVHDTMDSIKSESHALSLNLNSFVLPVATNELIEEEDEYELRRNLLSNLKRNIEPIKVNDQLPLGEKTEVNNPIENESTEEEDCLRSLLLSSLSKKIRKKSLDNIKSIDVQSSTVHVNPIKVQQIPNVDKKIQPILKTQRKLINKKTERVKTIEPLSVVTSQTNTSKFHKIVERRKVVNIELPKKSEPSNSSLLLGQMNSFSSNGFEYKPVKKLVISLTAGSDTDESDEYCNTYQEPVSDNRVIDNSSPSIIQYSCDTTSNLPEGESKLGVDSQSTMPNPDFEGKLDAFLLQCRTKVESISNEIDDPVQTKKSSITPKAVDHLPLSSQLEYHRLRKRMAILEKKKAMKSKKSTELRTTITIVNNGTEIEKKIVSNQKVASSSPTKSNDLGNDTAAVDSIGSKLESDIDSLLTKVYDAQDQQLKEFKLLLEYTKLKEQLQIISANLTEQKNITSKMVTGIFQDQRNIVNQYANYNQHRIKAVSKDQVNSTEIGNLLKDKLRTLVQETRKLSKKDITELKSRLAAKDDVKAQQKQHDEVEVIDSSISSKILSPPVIETDKREEQPQLMEVKNCDMFSYVSPLECIGSESVISNPDRVICPFELKGQCEDVDCCFQHLRSGPTDDSPSVNR